MRNVLHRPVRALLLLVALLPAAFGTALAQEDESGKTAVAKAADAVVAALDAGDEKALTDLASQSDPDPWNVADLLLGRGLHVAATQFVKATKGVDSEQLTEYVKSREGKPADAAARAACEKGDIALAAQDVAALLAAVDGVTSDGYLGARLRLYQGYAKFMSGEYEAAHGALVAAADAAKKLGWLKGEFLALRPAGVAFLQSGDVESGADALERVLAIEEHRKNYAGAVQAAKGLIPVLLQNGLSERALPIFERLIVASEGAGDTSTQAAVMVDLGNQYVRRGDAEKARPLLEKGLALCEEIGRADWAFNALAGIANLHSKNGEVEEAARAYVRAADLLHGAGDLQRAIDALAAADHNFQRAGKPDASREALAKGRGWTEAAEDATLCAVIDARVAILHKMAAEYDTALQLAEAALAVLEAADVDRYVEEVLGTIGLIHQDRGDMTRSREFLERALERARARSNSAGEAGLLVNLGNVEQAEGRHARALELFELGRELAEATGQPEFAATALSNMSSIHSERGAPREALRALRAGLTIRRGIGDRLGLALDLVNLGVIESKRGNHQAALEALVEARAIYEGAGARSLLVKTLTYLGQVHCSAANLDEAKRIAEEALALVEEIDEPVEQFGPRSTLASVELRRGRFAAAFDHQQRAVDIARKLDFPAALATALLNLAGIHSRLGEVESALQRQGEARAILERIEATEALAQALIDSGVLLVKAGRLDEARASVEAGLEKALQAERADFASVARQALALICSEQGDAAGAVRFAEAAASDAREHGDPVSQAKRLTGLATLRMRAGDNEGAARDAEESLRLAREVGAADAEAFALEIAATLHAEAGEHEQAVARMREVVELLPTVVGGLADEQRTNLRDRWENVEKVGVASAVALGRPADVAHFVECSRAGTLLAMLGGRENVLSDVLPPELAAAERAARLEVVGAQHRLSDAVADGKLKTVRAARKALTMAQQQVIDVVRRIQLSSRAAGATIESRPIPLAEIQASLETGDVYVAYSVLDENLGLALVVTAKEARLVDLGDLSGVLDAAAESRDAARLRAALVDPLKLDAAVRRVLICPTAGTAYVPFAQLLGDRDIVYVPSATTYALLRKDLPEPGTGVLALGDPTYDAKRPTGAVAALRGGALARLPGTREEVKAIATTPLLGDAATESGFARAVATSQRWRAVHFACHGLVDAEQPLLSSLAITPDAQDDGYLTVGEIIRMQIPADLVVLSACETGRGKVYASEGVVGFTRAFLFAGSPRVIVSLWKVDDEATRVLMTKFYELWKTKPAATALREAQTFVASQEKWSDPKYWAAWQLWGLP